MRSPSLGLDQDCVVDGGATDGRRCPIRPSADFGSFAPAPGGVGLKERGGHVDGSTQASPGRRDAGDDVGDGRGGLGLPRHATRSRRGRSTRRRASRRRRWASIPRPTRTLGRAAPMPMPAPRTARHAGFRRSGRRRPADGLPAGHGIGRRRRRRSARHRRAGPAWDSRRTTPTGARDFRRLRHGPLIAVSTGRGGRISSHPLPTHVRSRASSRQRRPPARMVRAVTAPGHPV